MKLFDGLSFEKKKITVLSAEKDSAFVTALGEYLKENGREECEISAPDTLDGKYFIVHSDSEADLYKKDSFIIGVINIDAMERRISDVVKGYEHLCYFADVSPDELVFPFILAKAVTEREKYDLLFIDGVNTVSKRFLARELAKNIRNGIGIRIINTDSGDTEILCR